MEAVAPSYPHPPSTNLFGNFRFQVLWIKHIKPQVLEGVPEFSIDLVIDFGKLQERGINRRNQLRK